MNKNKYSIFVALVASIAITMSGCATPISKDAVVVNNIQTTKHHQKTVSVKAQGGAETGAMDTPNISNENLAKAIEESIDKNGLFTQVIHGDNSDYVLTITVINMSTPVFGLSFTVTMETAWSLSEHKTKKVIMRDSIKSTHTASVGDAFVAVKRQRLAVEGAIRENIRLGLMNVAKLQID